MLRAIEVENFKPFGSRQVVPLSDITLLYGPNSGGKSSIIQALLVMKQTVGAEQRTPAAPLLCTGGSTDQGSFMSLLHRHDSRRTLRLGFEFDDFGDQGRTGSHAPAIIRDSYRAGAPPGSAESSSSYLLAVQRVYDLGRGFDSTVVRRRNRAVPYVAGDPARATFRFADAASAESLIRHIYRAGHTLVQIGEDDYREEPVDDSLVNWLTAAPNRFLQVGIQSPLGGWNIDAQRGASEYLKKLIRTADAVSYPGDHMEASLQRLLSSVLWLGPLRAYPARHYTLKTDVSGLVGVAGEQTLEVVAGGGEPLAQRLHQHLSSLEIPYTVSIEKLSSKVAGDLVMLVLRDLRTGTPVSSADVGFGISQLLPILVQGSVAHTSILCVEQPEIHLHPRLQASLGDFFIDTLIAKEPFVSKGFMSSRTPESNRNQWIIETHSEALMLRLQRRIREGVIPAEAVSVVYVDPRGSEGSAVIPLRLDDQGDFIDEWPGGFFEESYREIFGRTAVIARFAVDTTAITDDYGDSVAARGVHERFLRIWADHGVLVHGSDTAGAQELRDAIDHIPRQSVKTMWQQALRRHAHLSSPGTLPSLAHAECREDIEPFATFVRLACLETVHAFLAGLGEDEASRILANGKLELCRFDCADQAGTFRALSELRNAAIEEGEDCAEVWRSRFAPLAEQSTTVAVIDRYCLRTHRDFILDRDAARDGMSGLRRVLQGVDATRQPHVVHIFACVLEDDSMDEDAAAALLEQEVARVGAGGVREVRLHYGLTPKAFRESAHYRALRFDQRVCTLDTGLEALEGRWVRRRCPFTYSPRSDGHREVESSLRQRSAERVFLPRK